MDDVADLIEQVQTLERTPVLKLVIHLLNFKFLVVSCPWSNFYDSKFKI